MSIEWWISMRSARVPMHAIENETAQVARMLLGMNVSAQASLPRPDDIDTIELRLVECPERALVLVKFGSFGTSPDEPEGGDSYVVTASFRRETQAYALGISAAIALAQLCRAQIEDDSSLLVGVPLVDPDVALRELAAPARYTNLQDAARDLTLRTKGLRPAPPD